MILAADATNDYDVALGMVIQMGGKPASAGFDTFAEASAVKEASWTPVGKSDDQEALQ